MLKTYLYLPEELNRKIEKTSKLNGKSKAEIMRTALEEGLKRSSMANKKLKRQEYIKKLLSIKGDWFDYKEYKKNREDMEKRIKKLWNE